MATRVIHKAPAFSSGDFSPPANDTYWLGVVGNVWAGIRATTIVVTGVVTGDLVPSTTDTYNIGEDSTPLRWLGVYANTVTLTGGIITGGATADNASQIKFGGAFTAGNASTARYKVEVEGALTGDAAASAAVAGAYFNTDITLAGNTAIVAQVRIDEPNITLGGNTATVAASLYINAAPTEGAANDEADCAGGTIKTEGTIQATGNMDASTAFRGPVWEVNTAGSLRATGGTSGYYMLKTNAGTYEVARVQTNATQALCYFSTGGSQENKFYEDGTVSLTGALTTTKIIHINADDVPLDFGGSADFRMGYSQADANALCVMFCLPHTTESGNNVPVAVFGDRDMWGQDLTHFNGRTFPSVAVVDIDRDSYIEMTHSADDAALLRSNNPMGITSGGNLTMDVGAGSLLVNTSANGHGLKITASAAATGANCALINMTSLSSSPAVSDIVGSINVSGRDLAPATVEYGSMDFYIIANTAGAASGGLRWNLLSGGTPQTRMTLTNAGELSINTIYHTEIRGAVDGAIISARIDDGYYMVFNAKDTGVGAVEVGRIQGAADPEFKLGSNANGFGIRVGYSGNVGFFNTIPVAQQTGCAVPTDLTESIAAITALRTALNNLGLTTVV